MEEMRKAGNIDGIDSYVQQIEEFDFQLRNVRQFIKEASHTRAKLESVRGMAQKACTYWKLNDALRYATWLKYCVILDQLLRLCDEDKRAREAAEQAAAVAAKKDKAAARKDVIVLDAADEEAVSESVANVGKAGGADKEVELVLPEKARGERSERTIKGGRYSNEYAYIPFESYNLQLNCGRFGTKMLLHGHGFEWKDGVLRCTLCNKRLKEAIKKDVGR